MSRSVTHQSIQGHKKISQLKLISHIGRVSSTHDFLFMTPTIQPRDGHGTGLPVPRIFDPGISTSKLKIPGLSQSQQAQRFVSHGTIFGQPKFLELLGIVVTKLRIHVAGLRSHEIQVLLPVPDKTKETKSLGQLGLCRKA